MTQSEGKGDGFRGQSSCLTTCMNSIPQRCVMNSMSDSEFLGRNGAAARETTCPQARRVKGGNCWRVFRKVRH